MEKSEFKVEIYQGSTAGYQLVGKFSGLTLAELEAIYPGNLGYKISQAKLQLTTDITEQRKLIRCAELMLIKIALDAKSTHDLVALRIYEAQAQKTLQLLEIYKKNLKQLQQ